MFLVLLVLATFYLAANATTGSCATFENSLSLRLNNTCASVVDYAFYLPADQTLESLKAKADETLNNIKLRSYPVGCQTALRRLICAQVYLKCQPGIELNDLNTYNYEIYKNDSNAQFPLPFQRPCRSLCTPISSKCVGLYMQANTPPNCNATFDYSFGESTAADPNQYDHSNNNAFCFETANVAVASQRESYQFADSGGVCAGIVEDLYVPPGNKVASYYGVLQDEYVIQGVVESMVSSRLVNAPVFLPSSCALALRRYVCLSVFLRPQDVLLRNAILHSDHPELTTLVSFVKPTLAYSAITLPSYPIYSVCTDYQEQCADIIAMITAPALIPNCTALVPDTNPPVHRYPQSNQTVVQQTTWVNLTSSSKLVTLNFITSPNDDAEVDYTRYTYSPTCPSIAVVPEHPEDENTQAINPTACALPCRVAVWTENEWSHFENSSKRIAVASTALTLILLLMLCVRRDFKDTYLIITYTLLAFVVSVVSAKLTTQSFESSFCYDNAINLSMRYGSSLCATQGGLIIYTFLACCGICFFLMLTDVLRFHSKVDVDGALYISIQMAAILLLPIIPTAYAASQKIIGFNKSQLFCYIMPEPFGPRDTEYALVFLPVLILTILTGLLAFVNLAACFFGRTDSSKVAVEEDHLPAASSPSKDSEAKEGDKDQAKEGSAAARRERSTAVYVFVLVMFTVWVGYLVIKAQFYYMQDDARAGAMVWFKCAFSNFHDDGDAWKEICGDHPVLRPKVPATTWLIMCLTGNGIIVALVFIIQTAIRWLNNAQMAEEDEEMRATRRDVDEEYDARGEYDFRPKPKAGGRQQESYSRDFTVEYFSSTDVEMNKMRDY